MSAEAHSWWDDVQHLKPESGAQPVRLVEDDTTVREAAEVSAGRRRARLAEGTEPCLSRSDAADFADAFDLDGAFGAPRKRFARAPQIQDTDEGPVIVLERSPAPPPAASDTSEFAAVDTSEFAAMDVEEERRQAFADEVIGEAPERDPETGRRHVRITGRPEGQVTPRRLREIEPRRQRRSVAERALSSPDRMALYAVLLGLFLVVLAAASASPQP
jgi:hypothetical protein